MKRLKIILKICRARKKSPNTKKTCKQSQNINDKLENIFSIHIRDKGLISLTYTYIKCLHTSLRKRWATPKWRQEQTVCAPCSLTGKYGWCLSLWKDTHVPRVLGPCGRHGVLSPHTSQSRHCPGAGWRPGCERCCPGPHCWSPGPPWQPGAGGSHLRRSSPRSIRKPRIENVSITTSSVSSPLLFKHFLGRPKSHHNQLNQNSGPEDQVSVFFKYPLGDFNMQSGSRIAILEKL